MGRAFQKKDRFDNETFQRYVQYQLQMTTDSFFEQQRRELLASRMRDLLRGGVNVATSEVKTEFEHRNNQVNLEYVRFSWHAYENESSCRTRISRPTRRTTRRS